MSALSGRQAWPAAAHVLVRASKKFIILPPPTAVPSASRRSVHAPSTARRAAVAYAIKPSTSRYASSSKQDDYIEGDEFDEPLSAAARADLERALHPAWDDLGAQKHWEDEDVDARREKDEVYHDAEMEEDHGEWREWMDELRKEAMGKRGEVAAVKEQRKAAEPTAPTPEFKSKKPTSTRPAPQPFLAAEELIRSRAALSPSPIKPYYPPPIATSSRPQTYHRPLLSRDDWRLSSPMRYPRPTPRKRPPSLGVPVDMTRQGHNKLIGVGVECAKVGLWTSEMAAQEQWGWKVKVPESERGTWIAADVHRKRLERLLTLTEQADEISYLEQLSRSGTPEEREMKGVTVCHARGRWLTDAKKAEQIASLTEEERKAFREDVQKGGGKAIAEWRDSMGASLGKENAYKFVNGTILRFTPLVDEDSGPQKPVNATVKHPQGTVLDVREGHLIVAFKEADMWLLGEEEYRIDLGNDVSSYALQRMAINNLYFDPSRQRARNAQYIQDAQDAHAQGHLSILREWSLLGTGVRELIVPDLDAAAEAEAARLKADDPSAELFEDDTSPAAEIAHLPLPILPLPGRPNEQVELNPSSLFTDNQLINSWIKRHQRDNPMSMTGDPVLRLNASQTKAVAMAMGERLSLIQGPPGTGKSQTIVSIIALLKLHFRIPHPILLAAPTHVSVDHLLSLLIREGLNPLRSGKADKVREDLQAWTVEKRREEHPLWPRFERVREESEENRLKLQVFKERGGKKDTPELVQQELDLEAAYRKSWRKYIALEQRLYSSLFATADVFCGTALGSGASKVMSMVDFPIVFLDEAAMCTEPVTLVPLMKGAEHVCLIGDHKQLPAVVKSREAVKERLHVSLFERLMAQRSVKSVLLDTQYRMRPAISSFPNHAFYKSALEDSTSVSERPPPPISSYLDPSAPSIFISHSYPESTYRYSTRNVPEADIIVQIVGDLLARNPSLDPEEIGIISPYFAQTRLLQDMFQRGDAGRTLRPLLGWKRAAEVERVEVNTVDGFQGREKGIIILSTVRSNARGSIGFLTDQRRLNVALTRAKDALFVVGDQRTLKRATMSEWMMADEEADGDVWRRYLAWMEERGLVREWKEEETSEGREQVQEDEHEEQDQSQYV